MLVATRDFKLHDHEVKRGQKVRDLDSRLRRSLTGARYVVELDEDVPKQLVVTNKARKVEYKEEPSGWFDVHEHHEVVEEAVPTRDGGVTTIKRPVSRTEKVERMVRVPVERRGFEWCGKWYNPGDVLPEDNLNRNKRRSLLGCGWIEEVEAAPKPKSTRTKSKKRKKHKRS